MILNRVELVRAVDLGVEDHLFLHQMMVFSRALERAMIVWLAVLSSGRCYDEVFSETDYALMDHVSLPS